MLLAMWPYTGPHRRTQVLGSSALGGSTRGPGAGALFTPLGCAPHGPRSLGEGLKGSFLTHDFGELCLS